MTVKEGFPRLADAKAWCEEQYRLADASQPEIPLPKPGELWGAVGKPETRRFVTVIDNEGDIYYAKQGEYNVTYLSGNWHAWVRESGAVELVGDREALAARVKELEAKDGYVVAAEWRNKAETAEAARMEAKEVASEAIRQRDEFKRIGQQFERDFRATFEQSCANLKRAEIAEASRDRLADRLRKIESLWCHHASHLAQDILAKEGLPS